MGQRESLRADDISPWFYACCTGIICSRHDWHLVSIVSSPLPQQQQPTTISRSGSQSRPQTTTHKQPPGLTSESESSAQLPWPSQQPSTRDWLKKQLYPYLYPAPSIPSTTRVVSSSNNAVLTFSTLIPPHRTRKEVPDLPEHEDGHARNGIQTVVHHTTAVSS